jgi:hypothetical protein
MSGQGIVNLPDPNLTPYAQYNGIQIRVELAMNDSAIILMPYGMPYGTNFHPATLAISLTTGLTLEYTCSSRAAIKGSTAMWVAQTSPTTFNAIHSQITGIRLTTTSNAINAELAI